MQFFKAILRVFTGLTKALFKLIIAIIKLIIAIMWEWKPETVHAEKVDVPLYLGHGEDWDIYLGPDDYEFQQELFHDQAERVRENRNS